MNCIYRIVWSHVSNSWVAVAENARGRGKSSTGPRLVAAALALAGASWGMPSAYAADAAHAAVSAGTGSVATLGNTTTITQVSQRLAIDWTSLSTAAQEALIFNQPNASAIALNRITGSSPSELLGSLSANGQVFILNPNGVLFGAGSQVNVGGLVASTLNMSNADLMAGNHVFTGTGGSVVNQGTLNAAPGGYLALLAPEVRNEGVMTASLGTALLAAGNKVTLNIDNGSLLGYSIDQGAINALAENKHLIQANGGQVLLSAKAMDALTTATVNNTGVIEAKTIQNKAGRILLMGDMETGTVNVGGTLDASALNGGDGGFVETSAAHVKVADSARVTTLASAGNTGKWLIDPNDFTISATGDMTATAVATALTGGNFEIATATMGTAGGNGDIHVNQAITRTDANTFTLTAERDININQSMGKTAGGAAGLTLSAGRDVKFNGNVTSNSGALALTANAAGDISGGGTLNLSGGALDLTAGGSINDLGQIHAGSLKIKATTGEVIMNSGVTWNANSFDLFAGTNIRGSDPGSALIAVLLAPGGNFTASAGSAGNGRIRLQSTNNAIGTLNLTAQGTGGGGQIDFTSDAAVNNAMITAAHDVNASVTGNLNLNALNLTGLGQNVNLAANGGTLTTPGALNTGTGNLTLSGGAISLGGALSAKDLSLSATNSLTINQDLTATGNLTLAASNAAIQQTAGVLAVSGTTGVNAGAGQVSLTGANNFNGAVSVSNSGANNVAITSTTGSLTLGTLSLGSGTLALTGANITQTGAITQAAGAGAVTVNGSGTAISLDNGGNNFTGAVGLNNSGSNAVVVRDANDLVLGASTLGGTLTATSDAGSISQTGALDVTGASTFTLNGSSKDVLLGTSANTFGGGVTVNGSGSVKDMAFRYGSGFAFPTAPSYSGTLALINDGGAINLGTQTFSGGLALTAAGGITLNGGTLQTGGAQTFNSAVMVGGTASLVSTGGAITFAGTVDGANALSTTSSGATTFNASVGGTAALASLSVNSGGPVVVQSGATLRAGDIKLTSGGGIGNGAGGAAAIDAARLSAINSGSGNIALSHSGTGTVVVTDLGQGDGIQNSAAGGNTSLAATNGSIQVLGSTVSAAGGNVVLSATGTSATHALEIVNNGATRSNITATGAGTITLSGTLTGGGASATGGSAGGVVVTSSSITSDTGAISITGTVSGASTGDKVERGFRLDSGTTVTSAGDISLTGTVSATRAITSYVFGQDSMGGEVANGATVSSTGGNTTLSGTANNTLHINDTGLAIKGKVQTGAAGKVTLTGAATMGVAAGTGLSTGLSSEITAGTGGLDITGTVSSSTTATSLSAVVLAGAASATGNIAVTGTASAHSASGVRSLDMQAGTLTGLGAATITLKGSGVPAPAPAASYDVNVFGTTVSTAGGQINLIGDRVRIDSSVNSGSAATVITPFSINRTITLGGSDETNALNLSNSEINNITASLLRLGSSTARGGISIGNTGGTINMTGIQTLSLLNSSTLGTGITQSAGFTVANLNADARTVTLNNSGNNISQVSGRSYTGAFQVSSNASLSVGTVDGTAGIHSGANATVLASLNGAIAGTQAVTAGSLNASARDGITLTTNVSGSQTLSTTGAGGNISITGSNALDTANFSITTDGASAQTVSLSSGNGIIVGSAFGNSQDKLKLIATGGNIAVNGALTASELTLSTTGTSTQTAAITATGLELLGSGTHTLNNAGNAVTTLAGNTGNVDYSQAGALAIGTVNTAGLTASGKVLVRATGAAGDITLNNTVTSGSAANDSLVLAAGRNFINNAGATPLNPGAGRFLVYSTDPTANSFGGFASTGNAFGRSYAANAPSDASMTSISGNRMVYSVTPVINITGDNQSKVYGAADPTLSYTVGSGLVAGDTAGSVLAGLLSAPTGSAASAGAHAITQGSLAAALGYGIAYTNGTLTVGKATVSVTGAAANNKTYDGSATATLGNIGTLTGLVYGEALTLNSTGATFADANAGTGKTVTATYSLSNGTGLASNYQLAAAPVTTTADIAKASLTVTANNDSRTVGAAPYAGGNGVSYSGFAGGETAAVLGGTLAYGGSSQGASAVGSYAIAAGGYSAANYTLAYVDGVLTISPVVVPPAPVVPATPTVQGGGAPANDAYLSAMYTLAKVGGPGGEGSDGGLSGNGADPSDALKAAAAEAGNTGEE